MSNIAMNKMICNKTYEAKMGTDIIVPDSKPDVGSVLYAFVTSNVGESYVSKDKITISGVMCINIIYKSDEETPRICSINYKSPFSHQIDIKDADKATSLCVTSKVCGVDFTTHNSRKVGVSAILMFDVLLIEYIEEEITISCDENIPIKTNKIMSYNNVLAQKDDFCIEYQSDAVDAVSVLNCCAKITSKDVKVINNKVILKGSTKINVLFEMENKYVKAEEYTADFTEVLDVKDIDPNMICTTDLIIKETECDLSYDGEKTVVNINVLVSALTSAYDEYPYDLLCDAYSPDYAINTEKKNFTYQQLLKNSSEKIMLTDFIDVSRHSASNIYNVELYPKITKQSVIDGRVNIEGTVNANAIFFSSNDEGLFAVRKNIPFTFSTDVKTEEPSSLINANVFCESSACNINVSGEIEIRLTLELNITVYDEKTEEFITSISLDKSKRIDKTNIASITIYFVQKGDSLWNIAKKYHTTVEKIALVNNIDENKVLNVGERLLIPKNSD